MARFFGFNNKIKVNVANGSTHNISCRLYGDHALVKQGATGGDGVKTHKDEQIQHIAAAITDYIVIPKGNTIELESNTSSNSIYLTVLRENGRTICKTHEIGTSRNYIIDRHEALLNAERNEKWIDTNGRNHMEQYDDEDALNKKECSDPNDFRPEIDFNSQFW